MLVSTDPMTIWKHYYLPEKLDEALEILYQVSGSVRVIAGGTDLLLDLQQGRHPPVDVLVDVTRVSEMQGIEKRDADLFIGAAVSLRTISTSSLVGEHAQALAEACGLVGGPQVRNTATLGGNVAHGLPAADGSISMMALNCRVAIASKNGTRQVPLDSLFKGPGQSTLDPVGEILVGFYVPLKRGDQASAFGRVMRPQGVALPILNMSVWVDRSGETVRDVRIAVGPSGPVPQRIGAAEDALRGSTLDQQSKRKAFDALLRTVRFRTSPQRATADYRNHLAGVLLDDVFDRAWQRTFDSKNRQG
jgi:carbon-monoxide dehydrogenase medium subunit